MKKTSFHLNRLSVLIIASFALATIIFIQLIRLQIIKHGYYFAIAQKEHSGYTELPARRGEILTLDSHSGETFKLATNITLDLLYADPTIIENKKETAKILAPLLFNKEEARKKDNYRVETEWKKAQTEEEKNNIKPKTEEELRETFEEELQKILGEKIRDEILLEENLTDEVAKDINELQLKGTKVLNRKIYVYPKEIENTENISKILSPLLEIKEKELNRILAGKNRFIILKRTLEPETSAKIRELLAKDVENLLKGIGLQENYYRYYPENESLAQILGFVDHNGEGQYGIEQSFEEDLKGKEGIFVSQTDGSGQQITVGESIIRPAVDGNNIILTIDRSIQLEIEKKLEAAVKRYQAETGQVIIMEPKTGKILSLAQYPTFDPNKYSKIFEKEIINLSEEEIKNLISVDKTEKNPTRFWLYINTETNRRIEIFKEQTSNGNILYKKYKNRVGPKVYKNSLVSDLYEPGSVFKTITMASALNAGEVRAGTTFYEGGPIVLDDGNEIHNSTETYRGIQTMTQVLENSSNVGISFVAKKLGRNLFYNYMKNFGFAERTDIELQGEESGKIEFFTDWAESELLTHGFGQGILVTPIQMVTAISAIANGGLLMQPYIVDSIEKESGEIIKNEPKIIRRVITKENADILSSMMVSAVENGVARRAQTSDHYVAGKTGTSQTYKNGKPLKGAGTTVTSMAGFGPMNDPKFVILIKFDYPLSSPWGDSTAAPLFSEIVQYLFNYYNIPPDKNL